MKILYLFIWFFISNVVAQDFVTDDTFEKDVKFIQDFVKTVYADELFTVDDQKKFLGESTWGEETLKKQFSNDENLKQILENNRYISLLGVLLQLKKDELFYIPNQHVALIWNNIGDMVEQSESNYVNPYRTSIRYIIMDERIKPITKSESLNDVRRVIIWAISQEKSGKRYIDLNFTFVDGKNVLEIIGFSHLPQSYLIGLPKEQLIKLGQRIGISLP
jgi:hypothetical protein